VKHHPNIAAAMPIDAVDDMLADLNAEVRQARADAKLPSWPLTLVCTCAAGLVICGAQLLIDCGVL
jgi:hypothetical protein